MKTIKYLVVLVCLAFVSISSFAQEKKLRIEDDGFQWYELIQGDKRGAQSMGGVTFIPLSRGYDWIVYHESSGGWFGVEKKRSSGACDITGREIVAPGRYDDVSYNNDDGFEYCEVKLNGKEGICDMNGREVIAPKYDMIFGWHDGYFHVTQKKESGGFKEGACDKNGREIIPVKYDFAGFLTGGHVLHYKDSSGKMVSTGISRESLNEIYTTYSFSSSSNSSSSSTSTNNTVTPTPTPNPQPQPQPQPQPRPMQVWKPCPYCQGSGKCHVCLGDGHPLTNPTGTCVVCNGRGICSHCAGHGGQNVIEYH